LKTGLADVTNEGFALSTVHFFPPEHPTWSFRSESLSIFLSRKSELKVHRCADDSLDGSGFLFAFGFLSSWMLVVRDFGLCLVVRCYVFTSPCCPSHNDMFWKLDRGTYFRRLEESIIVVLGVSRFGSMDPYPFCFGVCVLC
jgi:hypothetical protein